MIECDRRFSAHIGYLFTDRAWEARIHAAAAHGFSAVEHPAPYDIPCHTLAGWLARAGLPFAQLALPSGSPERGEKGLACLRGESARFRDSIDIGLDYAEEVGCRFIHVMAGVIPSGTRREQLWSLYLDNLLLAAEAAGRRGITLLVEPIGRATIANYFMDDPHLAVRALRELDHDNIRLLFDAFHAANAGIDPARFAEAHMGLIGHVQIADHPGRHEPGTGHLDFPALYAALDAGGYQGFIGCEYVPATTTEAGLSWLASEG